MPATGIRDVVTLLTPIGSSGYSYRHRAKPSLGLVRLRLVLGTIYNLSSTRERENSTGISYLTPRLCSAVESARDVAIVSLRY